MLSIGHRSFGQIAAVLAAALLSMAVGLGPVGDSRAQNKPKDARAQRKAPPPKAPVQIRKNVVNPALAPNRGGPPRGQALGANPRPFGARIPPSATTANPKGPNTAATGTKDPRANPLAKGPNKGPNANAKTTAAKETKDPRATPPAKGANAASTNAKSLNTKSTTTNAKAAPNTKSANVTPPATRPGSTPTRPGSRGFTNRDPRLRAVNAPTPQLRQVQRTTHRVDLFAARARIPVRPLPGERNFTGVPPAGETRFVSTEMVCQFGPDMSRQAIEETARRHNLTIVAVQQSALTGGTLVQFGIGGGRATPDVVRAMEAERIVSQPNYVYVLNEDEAPAAETASAQSETGGSEQYVVNKLRLAEVHKIATGKGVTVAVIDSQIDSAHPELAPAIAEKFDAVGQADQPHTHGTGMAGAIVSQSRLMGIAPGAKALAVHAFSTGTQQSPQATTRHIVAGLEWAMSKGARIINMSFAGPFDPVLALALKKASEKGAILIAAVGNAGPKSPPLYPAADSHVIGVTATDEDDKLYSGSNIGAQVAVAAPGVDVMVPAPADAYQLTTGTSVAAAHVSGVAALLLERHPEVDATTVLEVLTASATRLGTNKRDDKLGWGLIDPLAALAELDARLADAKVATTAPAAPAAAAKSAAAPAPAAKSAAAPTARSIAPAAANAKPALPRPGIYLPKQ